MTHNARKLLFFFSNIALIQKFDILSCDDKKGQQCNDFINQQTKAIPGINYQNFLSQNQLNNKDRQKIAFIILNEDFALHGEY